MERSNPGQCIYIRCRVPGNISASLCVYAEHVYLINRWIVGEAKREERKDKQTKTAETAHQKYFGTS